MKLLLDTHTLLWMSLDDSQLSENARELLADLTNDQFISPASYWESAIKISLGKYQLTEPLDVFVDREIEGHAAWIARLEADMMTTGSQMNRTTFSIAVIRVAMEPSRQHFLMSRLGSRSSN